MLLRSPTSAKWMTRSRRLWRPMSAILTMRTCSRVRFGIAVQGARFGESRTLYERWNKLRPGEPRSDEVRMAAAAEAVDRGAFSERAAQRVVRLAHEVRLSAGGALRWKLARSGVRRAGQVRTRYACSHVAWRCRRSERSVGEPRRRRRRTDGRARVEFRTNVHWDEDVCR